MAISSKDDFLKCLKASKVIELGQLEEFLAKTGSDDPKKIAADLVRDNLLTKWQAKYLLSGRSRLHVGNYRLLERIRRDEFGDRFIALQEQLERLVEIQILPKTLDDNKQRRNEFLKSASLAAKVDHPNMVHVYEIDQEKGRFYLVVEHIKGNLLSTFDESEFSEMDVARLAQQSLQGLKSAHDMNIVHGQINKDNLIITHEEQVKIQNLVMASFWNQDHAAISPVSDIRSVGELGRQMLNLIETKNTDAKTKLDNILSDIVATETANIEPYDSKLNSWIEENDTSSTQTLISGATVVQSQSASNSHIETVAAENEMESPPASATTHETFLRRQNPAVVISIAAVVCLSILGAVAWAAFAMTSDVQVAETAITKNPKPVSTSMASPERPHLRPRTSNKLAPDTARAKPITRKISAEDLEAAKSELANLGAQDNPVSIVSVEEPAELSAEGEAENAMLAQSPQPANEDALEVAELQRDLPGNENELVSPPAVAAAAVPAQNDTVAEEPYTKQADEAQVDFKKPFKNFPRFTDLGDISDTQSREIGKLYIPPNILIAVELISGAAISKSKIVFELERSASDKQRWIVNFRKRKASPPVKIGEFSKTDNSLSFQWDAGAAEVDSHNYLRNCVLRLTGNNDHVHFLTLRAPVEIEGLAVTKEDPLVKVETDIKWLPNPENLRIEVIPMPYDGIPKSFMYPPHRLLEKRQPVLIYFVKSEKYRYYYLQVDAEAKKTLKFQSALMFDPGDGSRPQVANSKLIQGVASKLSQLASMANARYEHFKDANRLDDMTKGDFDEFKKNLKKAAGDTEKRRNVAVEYEAMIPALYGKSIPLRVYFDLDNIQVNIAQSSPND